MDSNQSLAKIGVLALLAINVGAYCYFWPRHHDAAKSVAKAAGQDKGKTQLLPAKIVAEPVSTLPEPMPLAISNPPVLPAARSVRAEIQVVSEPTTDPVVKLVERIDNDKFPEQPIAPPVESAKREAPVKIEIGVIPSIPDPDVAVAPPLTPKMLPNLWQFQSEKIGNRTHLTARLRDAAGERVVVEFRIQCDRIETIPQTGHVQALGNISFNGAGWRGTCRNVTLPVHEPRLVLEGEVRISQDVLGTSQDGGLRGERIVWELPAAQNTGPTGVTFPLSR